MPALREGLSRKEFAEFFLGSDFPSTIGVAFGSAAILLSVFVFSWRSDWDWDWLRDASAERERLRRPSTSLLDLVAISGWNVN
jgi:hypothetical protein